MSNERMRKGEEGREERIVYGGDISSCLTWGQKWHQLKIDEAGKVVPKTATLVTQAIAGLM